jgi:two-component system, response regulator RegA
MSQLPEHAPTLLLVDDDAPLRERLGRALAARGYEVRSAGSAEEALALAAEDSPEYAVVDLRMPGPGGLELLQALRERDPATRVLVLTGYGSIATAVQAMRLGAVSYLPKPVDADDLLAAFTQAEGAPGPASPPAPADAPETPSLARVEWEHMQRVLADCGGNVSEAARRLGVHRRSLQRKLNKDPPRR